MISLIGQALTLSIIGVTVLALCERMSITTEQIGSTFFAGWIIGLPMSLIFSVVMDRFQHYVDLYIFISMGATTLAMVFMPLVTSVWWFALLYIIRMICEFVLEIGKYVLCIFFLLSQAALLIFSCLHLHHIATLIFCTKF